MDQKVSIDLSRHCPWCGSVRFEVTEGKGPHAAGLRCEGCGRHGGWLSKVKAKHIPQINPGHPA